MYHVWRPLSGNKAVNNSFYNEVAFKLIWALVSSESANENPQNPRPTQLLVPVGKMDIGGEQIDVTPTWVPVTYRKGGAELGHCLDVMDFMMPNGSKIPMDIRLVREPDQNFLKDAKIEDATGERSLKASRNFSPLFSERTPARGLIKDGYKVSRTGGQYQDKKTGKTADYKAWKYGVWRHPPVPGMDDFRNCWVCFTVKQFASSKEKQKGMAIDNDEGAGGKRGRGGSEGESDKGDAGGASSGGPTHGKSEKTKKSKKSCIPDETKLNELVDDFFTKLPETLMQLCVANNDPNRAEVKQVGKMPGTTSSLHDENPEEIIHGYTLTSASQILLLTFHLDLQAVERKIKKGMENFLKKQATVALPSSDGAAGATVQSADFKWADFVFRDDYSRQSFAAVHEFVMRNSHLPWMRSEEEVKKTGIGWFSTTHSRPLLCLRGLASSKKYTECFLAGQTIGFVSF